MTARKLPMPGLRERRGGAGEEEEDAAVALRVGVHLPQLQRQGRSENGVVTPAAGGGGELQGRCSNHQQAVWALSNMHPLPRAARYVPGTPNHDSLRPNASSALGSSWIRRFLPTEELGGQEVARVPKAVREGAGAETGGGAGEQSGFQPAGPLLLASAANEQYREQQQQEAGMSEHRMGLDSCKEASMRISGNGEYFSQKGKAVFDREVVRDREPRQRETNTASQYNWGEDGVQASLWKVNTISPSHHTPPPGPYPVEGSSRQQLEQFEAGNHRTVLPPQRGVESHHGNGASGAMVMGFGSLKVVTKAPPTRVAVGGGSQPDADVPIATAAQPDHHRLSNVSLVPDRKPGGTQPKAGSVNGTKFTSLPKFKSVEDPSSGRSLREVEFASALGFPKQKKQAVQVEPAFGGGRPFMVPQADGARDNTTMVVSGGLKQAEPQPAVRFNPFGESCFKPRMETGHHMKFADPESGVERMTIYEGGVERMKIHEGGVERVKTGTFKSSERFLFSYPSSPAHLSNMWRKDDGRPTTENQFHNRVATEDARARPSSGAGTGAGFQAPENKFYSRVAAEDMNATPSFAPGAGFQLGAEKNKMKELVGGGFSSRRHTESGPSHQQRQHSPEIPSYASYHPFQGDLCMGKAGHTPPGSPQNSFPGEDNNSREDTKKPPFTNPFGAPQPYEDRMNGRADAPSEHQRPQWTSLFAAFKGLDQHPEQPNSSSPAPSLPADVHSRLQDGSANRPFEAPPEANGVHDDHSGEDVRMQNGDHVPEESTPSRFDNQGQSSHYSSSPWPDDEGNVPNDDTGSGPYNSQAAGSGQASRVANPRGSVDTKGKYSSAYGYDTGGREREGFGAPERKEFGASARCRDSYPSESGYRKYGGGHGEGGHHMSNGGNQAHGLSTPPRKHTLTPPMSGHKDDTSDSSPPSYPPGYTGSEMGSPVLPRGIVDEHLLSIAGKLKHVEVDSEMEGSRVPRMPKGYRKDGLGFLSKKPKDSGAANRDYKDANAFVSKVPDLHRSQRTGKGSTREQSMNREQGSRFGRPNEGPEYGPKHGKLRMSSEAMGEEGGTSGPSKRSRHGSNDVGTEVEGLARPSTWLQRWLPPPPSNVAKSRAGFARPKDNPRNGLNSEHSRNNGNTHFMGGFPGDRSTHVKSAEARGKEVERGHEMRHRMNGVRDLSGSRGLNGLPPHPVPSAAAMALAGAATRRIGPFPHQRKGSVSMWPPVHLHTGQGPNEGQQSSRSPELSL